MKMQSVVLDLIGKTCPGVPKDAIRVTPSGMLVGR
ncbi:hypothetical protein ACVWWO_003694 [Bradyrhizobium sp. F1.13.1]